MLESLKKKLQKWATKKTYRLYQVVIFALVIVVSLPIAFSNPVPSSSFSADGWAQMSVTIGASILTLVAIIASIGLSSENNRRLEFNESLSAIVNKIDDKKRHNPDKSISDVYEASKQKLQDLIDSNPILRYTENLIGILGFFFFLLSAVFPIMGFSFVYTIGFFANGLVLLVGYVTYVIEEFAAMDKFSHIKKKYGNLNVLDIKINGIHRPFEIKNKEAFLKLNRSIERMEFKIRFEGVVRNGFLHTTVKYLNGLVSFIPDSNTFLANFGFIDNYHLTLLEKEFDTGTIQLDKAKDTLDLHLEVILRSSKGTDENPLIAKGFIEQLGKKAIFKHCSLTENFVTTTIELRIYEDPLYKTNFKRREVDCITLHIEEPKNQTLPTAIAF